MSLPFHDTHFSYLQACGTSIRQCQTTGALGGGAVVNDAIYQVLDCSFDSNTAESQGGGLYLSNSTGQAFDNTFTRNGANIGAGMYQGLGQGDPRNAWPGDKAGHLYMKLPMPALVCCTLQDVVCNL